MSCNYARVGADNSMVKPIDFCTPAFHDQAMKFICLDSNSSVAKGYTDDACTMNATTVHEFASNDFTCDQAKSCPYVHAKYTHGSTECGGNGNTTEQIVALVINICRQYIKVKACTSSTFTVDHWSNTACDGAATGT